MLVPKKEIYSLTRKKLNNEDLNEVTTLQKRINLLLKGRHVDAND